MYRCIDAGWDPSPGPRVSPPRPWAQSQPHVHAPRSQERREARAQKKRPKKITPPLKNAGGQPREHSWLPNEEGYATADTGSDQPSVPASVSACAIASEVPGNVNHR